jgi:hypothetical protein
VDNYLEYIKKKILPFGAWPYISFRPPLALSKN